MMIKRAIKIAGKARCGKGWTSVSVKVGRQVRRVCIQGKVSPKGKAMDRITRELFRKEIAF